MSNGLLGMDIAAAQALADTIASWSGKTEDIRTGVIQAVLLSEVDGCDIALIDGIGDDSAVMAAAIRRAADDLSSFSIELVSPASVVAAVAAVHHFRGSDNDPERDRRLRTLRGLVDAATDSDDQAAHVMAALLAAGDPADVERAMAEIEQLNRAESIGAIGSNDRRIDQATGTLRTALASHAASEEHLDYLTAAFLADNNTTPASILLASLLTGRSSASVRLAHEQGWDYDIATGWLFAQQIDRLTAAIATAPFPEVAGLERERAALFVGLSGVTNAAVLAQFGRRADSGASAIEVVPVVLEEVRDAEVETVADEYGLPSEAASVQLDEMTASIQALVATGFEVEDAARAVGITTHTGQDISVVVELATQEGSSLADAEARLRRAEQLGMSLDELDAFDGFIKYFDLFDTARGGEADKLVSLADVRFARDNYHMFGPTGQQVALAAAAFLAATGLQHRLDSAAQTGDVVSHEPFGSDRDADNKYSVVDIEQLHVKQTVNYVLRDRVDQIDVVGNGGAYGWVDGNLSEFDFEHVRAHHQAYGLTEVELEAIDLVLANDWYTPTFWQEHGDSFIMGAAVVAGVLAGAATAGVGTGVVSVLVSAAAGASAGASTGAGLTLAENALTGDPLTQDLVEHSLKGAVAGMTGAALHGYADSVASPLAVRLLQVVGPGVDTVGLAATGLFDPLLDPLLDDIELDEMHDGLQTANYLTGAASLAGAPTLVEAVGIGVVRTSGAAIDQLLAGTGDDSESGDLELLPTHD